METADVVVIGAGANGTSTAFHLAKAGVKRVVVVERQYVGFRRDWQEWCAGQDAVRHVHSKPRKRGMDDKSEMT